MLEQFARLNAKTASYVSSGIAPLLDVTDLCGILASLPDQHSWYIYAMIEQRRAYNMDLLHRYCQQLVLQEMLERKLKLKIITTHELAHGVTKAVIYAHFHPKGKCNTCNGLGFIAAKKCEKCVGAGSIGHKWAERLEYGFPMRKDLSRQWYRKVCSHYDQLVESILIELQIDLAEKLHRMKKQARQFKEMDNASLLDDV